MQAIFPPAAIPVHTIPPGASSDFEVFDSDGAPHIRFIAPFDPSPPTSAHFRDTSARTKEVVDTTELLYGLFNLSPQLLLPTDLR